MDRRIPRIADDQIRTQQAVRRHQNHRKKVYLLFRALHIQTEIDDNLLLFLLFFLFLSSCCAERSTDNSNWNFFVLEKYEWSERMNKKV